MDNGALMAISIAIWRLSMTEYSVADAKNHLPKLIDKALAGEEVIITRRGKPMVELKRVPVRPSTPKGIHEWLFQRTRARPSVGLTSVQILDLLNETDQDEHIFGRKLSDPDTGEGTGKRGR
jgi:antitoxin (DNA-binding transcriptional repressor) of toxin-antitoxin stability system